MVSGLIARFSQRRRIFGDGKGTRQRLAPRQGRRAVIRVAAATGSGSRGGLTRRPSPGSCPSVVERREED